MIMSKDRCTEVGGSKACRGRRNDNVPTVRDNENNTEEYKSLSRANVCLTSQEQLCVSAARQCTKSPFKFVKFCDIFWKQMTWDFGEVYVSIPVSRCSCHRLQHEKERIVK